MILKALAVGPFASNCYIVGSEKTKEGMIIDPGADAPGILKTVREMGLKIALIVLTHAHIDHITALKPVKEKLAAPLAMHGEEYKSMGLMKKMGDAMVGMMGLKFDMPSNPERLLKDGDVIEIGDLKFTVLHTPGHSPGGICLLGEGIVFTGDTLFNYGIGRTDFPGSSYEEEMDSISKKLMVLPDETVVLPGHGPSSTVGRERKGNPFIAGAF